MKKKELQSFISRYHLGGLVDTVKITSEEGTLSTAFTTPDRSNVGYIKMEGFDTADFEIGVYTTGELLKLLNVLDDDIKFELGEKDGRVNSLKIKDKKVLFNYVLADLSIIPEAPGTTELPDFETKILITQDFIDNFVKSYAALSDCKLFSVESNGKSTVVTMNYSTDNTSNIKFPVKVQDNEHTALDEPICFSADFLKSILAVNRGSKEALLEISNEGLARITFKDNSFEGTYFMLKMEIR